MIVVSCVFVSCDQYDDSGLKDSIDALDKRITTLEELCSQMNTNVSSLQSILTALQTNDHITSVTPTMSGGQIVGYTIAFAKASPITIYHGENGKNGEDGSDGKDGQNGVDGKDGAVPVIGIRLDTDGVYYWTLNSEWLKDGSGYKVKAEGRDGNDGQNGSDGDDGNDGKDGQNGSDGEDGDDGSDGITPQFKIENGYWHISYNDGASWTQLGKATGDKGEQGDPGHGGGIFKKVEDTGSSVIFTLNDDTTITIPKTAASANLDIVFSNTESINVLPGKTYEIEYTITGADATTQIEVVSKDLYKASVSATDYRSGKIIVTIPSGYLETSRVLVFVSKGTNTIMRVINFVESVIIVSTNTVEVAAEGETVQVTVETNVAYTVEIPTADQSWLSLAATRAATHEETLTFTVGANPSTAYRFSTVKLKDANGLVVRGILFAQKVLGAPKTVHVATAGTLRDYISFDETRELIGLKLTGKLNFDDYYFMGEMPALESVDLTGIDDTTMPLGCFQRGFSYWSKLKTVILPSNLTAIPDWAFAGSDITSISAPGTIVSIGNRAFSHCDKLILLNLTGNGSTNTSPGELIIPNSVTSIGMDAFGSCSSFESITIGSGLTKIPDGAFAYCGFKGDLIIPDGITEIGAAAFLGCQGFYETQDNILVLGESLASIGELAFVDLGFGCLFDKVYCRSSSVPECFYGMNIHEAYSGCFYYSYFGEYADHYSTPAPKYLGVPYGCKEAYASAEGWNGFTTIEEVDFLNINY